jgi:hypothetical protein
MAGERYLDVALVFYIPSGQLIGATDENHEGSENSGNGGACYCANNSLLALASSSIIEINMCLTYKLYT